MPESDRQEREERHETRRVQEEASRYSRAEAVQAAEGGAFGVPPEMVAGAWVHARLGETATRDAIVAAVAAFGAREV